MMYLSDVLHKFYPNTEWGIDGNSYEGLHWSKNNTIDKPTEEEINAKIQELQAAEPLRLLRLERTRLLTETDWEMTRILETQDKTSTAYINLNTYREALRNLPQEIETGNIEAPTLDETGNLVFSGWPERVTE